MIYEIKRLFEYLTELASGAHAYGSLGLEYRRQSIRQFNEIQDDFTLMVFSKGQGAWVHDQSPNWFGGNFVEYTKKLSGGLEADFENLDKESI